MSWEKIGELSRIILDNRQWLLFGEDGFVLSNHVFLLRFSPPESFTKIRSYLRLARYWNNLGALDIPQKIYPSEGDQLFSPLVPPGLEEEPFQLAAKLVLSRKSVITEPLWSVSLWFQQP